MKEDFSPGVDRAREAHQRGDGRGKVHGPDVRNESILIFLRSIWKDKDGSRRRFFSKLLISQDLLLKRGRQELPGKNFANQAGFPAMPRYSPSEIS